MRLSITHLTRYRYSQTVGHSSQIAHLRPRLLAGQRCLAHSLQISPAADYVRDDQDYFGNPITRFELCNPHDTLVVRAHSEVELVRDAGALPDSPSWEGVQRHFARPQWGITPDSGAGEFLFASPYIPLSQALRDFAEPDFPPGRPLLEACTALMTRIHASFEYDPDATHVATPLAEVLLIRRGVCQDFAHLMIGSLRAMGLPARYVSGYLLTEPPPGQPRLEGADASHAWVSAYVPDLGWTDFDPTNALRPGNSHITVAWGRDFGDVSPLRGVILGGGNHHVDVEVTVRPHAEAGLSVARQTAR